MKIEIVVGNIVKQPDMEAVVNSANANLRLGSGVAGAIHMAAGPELEKYCKPHAPLAYGSFLVTPGFKLPNFWVIHVRAASYEMNDDAPKLLEQAIEAATGIAQEPSATAGPECWANRMRISSVRAKRTSGCESR